MKERNKKILLWIGLTLSIIGIIGFPFLGVKIADKINKPNSVVEKIIIISVIIPFAFVIYFHSMLNPLEWKRKLRLSKKGKGFSMYDEYKEYDYK